MYNQVLVRFENENSKLFAVAGILIDGSSEVLCEFNLYDENGYDFLYLQTIDEQALVKSIRRDWEMIKHLIMQYKDTDIHFTRDDYTLYIIPLLESCDVRDI